MRGISFTTMTWTVHDLLRRWGQLRLDPDYQREGSIWSLSKRQLFIDSVLNGFDSPKLYLHELVPPEFDAGDSLVRYAVIDGQQRIEALRAFADGRFGLSNDFRLIADGDTSALEHDAFAEDDVAASTFSSLRLDDLRASSGVLARRFFAYPLTVVVVSTADVGYIEELFFRLNEGSPLTAAEKRNRSELLRRTVADIKSHPAFRLFSAVDRRGRHNDLAVRFMYFEAEDASTSRVPDMRARLLNDFAASFRPPVGEAFSAVRLGEVQDRLTQLANNVSRVLDRMVSVFIEADPLLKLVGDILTYYVLLRSAPDLATQANVRGLFEEFFKRASDLEGLDEEGLSADELMVLDYFGAVQGTTTGSYLAARARLVNEFVAGKLDLRPPAARALDI